MTLYISAYELVPAASLKEHEQSVEPLEASVEFLPGEVK